MLFRFSNSYNIGIYTTRKYTTCIRKNIILNIFNRMTNDFFIFFFFSSRRRHTRSLFDWSSDVCSSDLPARAGFVEVLEPHVPFVGVVGHAESRSDVLQIVLHDGAAIFFDQGVERVAGLPVDQVQPRRSEERRVGKECRCWWSTDRE